MNNEFISALGITAAVAAVAAVTVLIVRKLRSDRLIG